MAYEKLMSGMSDDELMAYLTVEKYTEDAAFAAVSELKKRGKQLSEVQVEEIKFKIEEKKRKKKEDKKVKSNPWTNNVVTDLDAPALYSHRAIFTFSTIFTVVFGAVLLFSNTKDKGNARWAVLLFGILYSGLGIVLLSLLPSKNSVLTFSINGLGAWIMMQLFWNKFIGAETKYRTKPIWKPLIISVLITIPFLLAIIYRIV
jgi:hypothetical protein